MKELKNNKCLLINFILMFYLPIECILVRLEFWSWPSLTFNISESGLVMYLFIPAFFILQIISLFRFTIHKSRKMGIVALVTSLIQVNISLYILYELVTLLRYPKYDWLYFANQTSILIINVILTINSFLVLLGKDKYFKKVEDSTKNCETNLIESNSLEESAEE